MVQQLGAIHLKKYFKDFHSQKNMYEDINFFLNFKNTPNFKLKDIIEFNTLKVTYFIYKDHYHYKSMI